MNVFLQGKTKAGTRLPLAVGEKGALLTQIDNGAPGFINVNVTNVPTALPDHAASTVEILNNTGSDLIIDHGEDTPSAKLATGNSHLFKLLASTSELRLSVVGAAVTPDLIEYWGGLQ
jgi:hypothetical protein